MMVDEISGGDEFSSGLEDWKSPEPEEGRLPESQEPGEVQVDEGQERRSVNKIKEAGKKTGRKIKNVGPQAVEKARKASKEKLRTALWLASIMAIALPVYYVGKDLIPNLIDELFGEKEEEVAGGMMTLSESLTHSTEDSNGSLAKFKRGVANLELLNPWSQRAMWRVVAQGGPLAPFVEERDEYIDDLFGRDVDTADMTRVKLERLLNQAVKDGRMTEEGALFYLGRFDYSGTPEEYYELLEQGPEALRGLGYHDAKPFGKTELVRGEVSRRQRAQQQRMRHQARMARSNQGRF